MKHAYIFPGQGSQYTGMGKNHFENNAFARRLFEQANEIIGFNISEVMFNGTAEELKQTNVTQPAIFIHSVIAFRCIDPVPRMDMVAGHSLGEFSALVANGTLSFEDGMRLVMIRAGAMQKACEIQPSTMAAILALEDEKVEEICKKISAESGEIVVPANFNCPGQVVISGTVKGVELACEALKSAGAKRAVILPVGGAFHSPLMEPAKEELKAAIEKVSMYAPSCPVYQNITAKPVFDKDEIKQNLIDQLTGSVKWTQTVQNMISDGAGIFTEVGPGKVLQGLVGKINKEVNTLGVE